jgi:hypothetical protein
MDLIKKVDVKADFATRRGLGMAAAEKASKQLKVGLSNSKAAAARMNSAEFLQDFSLEHSSRGANASLITGLSDRPRVPAVPRNLPA